jgi:hypothetical protein
VRRSTKSYLPSAIKSTQQSRRHSAKARIPVVGPPHFLHCLDGVTWGRGQPQSIFRWQRCPAKSSGWIHPRPSRDRKKSCCLPSLAYPLSSLSWWQRKVKRAAQAQVSGRPVVRTAGRKRAAVRPSAGERPSIQANWSNRPGERSSVQASGRPSNRPGEQPSKNKNFSTHNTFQEPVLFYAPFRCAFAMLVVSGMGEGEDMGRGEE